MIRRLSMWVAVAVLASASDASALIRFDILESVTSHGHPLDALVVGETLTLGIRFAEIDRSAGLSVSAWSYDESVIDFESGQAVPAINYATCIPHPLVGCSGVRLWNFVPGDLDESAFGGGGNRVQIFNGVSLDQTSTNPLDPGLDGVVGGNDAQFRITFVALGLGSTSIRIGTHYPGDGILDQSNHIREHFEAPPFQITVVPEPGSALLLALGLVGLGAARPSRRRA